MGVTRREEERQERGTQVLGGWEGGPIWRKGDSPRIRGRGPPQSGGEEGDPQIRVKRPRAQLRVGSSGPRRGGSPHEARKVGG